MKLSEAKQYVTAATIADADVAIERLITDEEFATRRGGDYRNRVIDRLVGLEVPFQSDANTISVVAKRYLKAVCPYCTKEMTCAFDGGASLGGFAWYSLTFSCKKCKARIGVSVPPDGIAFQPAKSNGSHG